MDIISTFNPPRLVQLAGETFWVRGFGVEDHAAFIAWLDDVVPGQAERKTPVSLESPEAQAAMNSPMGWAVLVWIALRHLGVSYEQAESLSLQASEPEKLRFLTVIYRRRGTLPEQITNGKDVSKSWWGPTIVGLVEHYHLSLDQIGRMTLDQIECISTDGAPYEDPDRLTVDQVQAMWEAERAKAAASKSAEAN